MSLDITLKVIAAGSGLVIAATTATVAAARLAVASVDARVDTVAQAQAADRARVERLEHLDDRRQESLERMATDVTAIKGDLKVLMRLIEEQPAAFKPADKLGRKHQ